MQRAAAALFLALALGACSLPGDEETCPAFDLAPDASCDCTCRGSAPEVYAGGAACVRPSGSFGCCCIPFPKETTP